MFRDLSAVCFLLPTLGGKEFWKLGREKRWQTNELECGLVGILIRHIPLLLQLEDRRLESVRFGLGAHPRRRSRDGSVQPRSWRACLLFSPRWCESGLVRLLGVRCFDSLYLE